MRFGWLAAAAAMVTAGQASAATWLRYDIEAFGYQRSTNGIGAPTGPDVATKVLAFFSVLVEPTGSSTGPGGFVYSADGSVFTATAPYFTFSADGTQSGLLRASQDILPPGGGGSRSRASISYTDTDAIGGLPTTLGVFDASGSVTEQSYTTNNAAGTAIFGSISRLTVSRATGFQSFSISAVPEAATWAMLIVGFALVGGVARRRGKIGAQEPSPAI